MSALRDAVMIGKGLALLFVLALAGIVAIYHLASHKDRDFHVRDLMKHDYRANRARRQEDMMSYFSDELATAAPTPVVTSEENTTVTAGTLSGETPSFWDTPLTSETYNITEILGDLFNTSSTGVTTENTTPEMETTMSTIPPTTTPALEPCFRQEYQIQAACDLDQSILDRHGPNVTLEQLSRMLFLSQMMDRLRGVCQPGSWCLQDDWALRADTADFLRFCGIGTCMYQNVPDDCWDEVSTGSSFIHLYPAYTTYIYY